MSSRRLIAATNHLLTATNLIRAHQRQSLNLLDKVQCRFLTSQKKEEKALDTLKEDDVKEEDNKTLSSAPSENKKPKVAVGKVKKKDSFAVKIVKKLTNNEEEEEYEERKGPFKNYYEFEEREKKSIMFYEEFFEINTKQKNRENFMVKH
jgi:hypothetical protein